MKLVLYITLLLIAVQGCSPAESGVEKSNVDEPNEENPSAFRVLAATDTDQAYTYAVDVRDSLAAFGRGRDVVVVNVSDPAHPRVRGSATLPGVIRDIALGEKYAYVAADSAGLQIIDLSSLAIVGGMPFDDRAYGVDVSNDRAYVAARSEGLRIIDTSNPASLSEIGHIITPDEAVDVMVRDEFAYVAAWYESMRVVDVSDPADPQEVSFASYDSYDNGAAWSVHVDGDIAVQAVPEMGLRTVDISDPRSVKLHKVYRGLFAPAGAAVRGRTAFVADQSEGFRVLDLADPVKPVEIGALRFAAPAMSVTLAGNVAYVAAREGGLRLIDISRPNEPRELSFIDPSDDIVDLAVTDDGLIAAGRQNGVLLYQSATLQNAARVGAAATRIAVHDGRLYAGGDRTLSAYSLTEATSATSTLPGTARGLAANAEIVMAAVEQFGIRIFSTSDLREIGSFEPERVDLASNSRIQMLRSPVAAWDVIMEDRYAYAAFDDGIRIIDISAPSEASVVAALPTRERAYRLAKRGAQLFAACDDGLRVFDVSDPAQPVETAYMKTPSFATAVVVDSETAYVGDLSGVVTVISAGENVTEIKVADQIVDLALFSGDLAVAAGRQGVRLIEMTGSAP